MSALTLRLALRKLRREPGLSLAITATLALGIGATAVAFSVIGGIILCRMPYQDPAHIVAVFSRFPEAAEEAGSTSYPDFEDFRRQSTKLVRFAATANQVKLNLTGGTGTERVSVNFVSASYFDVLGARAALGRTFLPDEDRAAGGRAVVVLGHDFWRRRFAADPQIIGKTVRLSDLSYLVIGVLPASFHDLSLGSDTDVWVPVTMASTVFGEEYLRNRRGRWLQAIGRLKPGATVAEARDEMTAIARRLERDHPDTNAGIGVTVRGLDDYLLRFNSLSRSVLVLTLAAVLVLLVALTNVSNLLLVQATGRTSEVALRLALGADRTVLMRQFVAEAALAALPGGCAGVLLADWGLRVLSRLAPIPLPAFMRLELDLRVVVGSLALSAGLGMLLGCLVAARLSRILPNDSLQLGSRVANQGRRPAVRRLLTAAEVAVAVALLIGAMLLAGNLRALAQTSFGFRTASLLTMQFELGHKYESDASRVAFVRRLLPAVRRLPGVRAAELWGPGQPGSSWWFAEILPADRDPDNPRNRLRVFRHSITPTALSSLGIRLVRGRSFQDSDRDDAPRVAIVSQTAARAIWQGEDPLGKRFRRVSYPNDPWITVVGVAADARHRGRQPEYSNPLDVYLPLLQFPVPAMTLILHTDLPPDSLAGGVRREVAGLDADLPLFNIATLEESLKSDIDEPSFYAWMLGVFAAIAAALAAVGLYGVISYSVRQQRHEIGIRMALGAAPAQVLRLVVRQVAAVVLTGVGVGMVGAYWLVRVTSASMRVAHGNESLAFLSAPLFLILVAAAASYLPLRRAARVDPAATLRAGAG